MNDLMTRRRFFQALAASALAAGVPLPVGLAGTGVMFVGEISPPDGYGINVREFYWIARYTNSGMRAELKETLGPLRLASDAQAAV